MPFVLHIKVCPPRLEGAISCFWPGRCTSAISGVWPGKCTSAIRAISGVWPCQDVPGHEGATSGFWPGQGARCLGPWRGEVGESCHEGAILSFWPGLLPGHEGTVAGL
mmetsp:Transcript_55544/g.146234  ORF Transcript_55544/g.146234 Transcript_55544/m.146234 type:complete len:108 (+) Transcript_55544:284-607(+)